MRKISTALAVAAVVLISLNLRPGASSVGPVLQEIQEGLHIGAGVAGGLTGLPGLCFGAIGLTAVALARQIGTSAGIAVGILLAATGLLLRSMTDSGALFLALSAVALAGMAVGNVLVPAWIKSQRTSGVLLPTIYGTGLILGGAAGSAVTAPLAAAGLGWRGAVGVWGALAAVAVPLWWWLAALDRRQAPPIETKGVSRKGSRMLHSPTAVAMAALFGIQSMHAYVQFGWLPQIYRDAGLSASTAGALQGLLSGSGIVGALLMPTVIARSRHLGAWMVGFGGCLMIGYAGLLLAATTLPWLWALTLGVAGWAFPTSIALLTARTRHASVTARLSGFVQPVGYALAAVGPFGVGLIHQASGDWDLTLVLLGLSAIPFTWAGLRAAREVWIDDEVGAVHA